MVNRFLGKAAKYAEAMAAAASLPFHLASKTLNYIGRRALVGAGQRYSGRVKEERLVPGTHIIRNDGFFDHHAIYSGNGKVIHYSKAGPRDQKGRVQESSFDQHFPKPELISVARYASPIDYDQSLRRAREGLGQDGYSLFFKNCEHFAVYCVLGEEFSRQADDMFQDFIHDDPLGLLGRKPYRDRRRGE